MSSLSILVNNRPIDKYTQKIGKFSGISEDTDETYVEGRKGKSYTIKYHNSTNKRQKIVVSVDGLNVMSGDSTWDRGYVVDAYGSIEIPGWRKDSENVAAFEFSDVRNSYNNLNDSGDTNNVGVIGCKVYNEVVKVFSNQYIHYPVYIYPSYPYRPWNDYFGYWQGPYYTLNGGNGVSYNASDSKSQLVGSSFTSNVNNFPQNSVNIVQASAASEASQNMFRSVDLEPQNALGTGWGENKEFKTQAVSADWEVNPTETIVIYYDSRRGLERRGIVLTAPVRTTVKPKAFPDGCPEPKYSRK